jgi:hypothetical protein
MDRPAHGDDAGDGPGDGVSPTERARKRWGIDRVRLVHPTLEDDDADLARHLQRHLRHLPVVMLHDRVLPGGQLAEFLAIGPGGVTVIAAAGGLAAPLRVHRLRGVFGAHAELLCDGTDADRSALLAPVRERLVAVQRLVEDAAPVAGALCLTDTDSTDVPNLARSLRVGGIVVGNARAVAALAAREGPLVDTVVAALVDRLDAACAPALL